jgi:DNA-binding NarL/FixJ family response regulator
MNSVQEIRVVIAAPLGIMSSSLRTFLHTLPGVRVVEHCTDQAGALSALGNQRPDCLIIDLDMLDKGFGLGNTLDGFIGQVRSLDLETQIMVLVNTLKQKRAAIETGADEALMKGMLEGPLVQFFSAVRQP